MLYGIFNDMKEKEEGECRAPTLGYTMHQVSVPGSVADTYRSNKIDIKNYTFIDNGETHYKVYIT
jgi:hypothetical protein